MYVCMYVFVYVRMYVQCMYVQCMYVMQDVTQCNPISSNYRVSLQKWTSHFGNSIATPLQKVSFRNGFRGNCMGLKVRSDPGITSCFHISCNSVKHYAVQMCYCPEHINFHGPSWNNSFFFWGHICEASVLLGYRIWCLLFLRRKYMCIVCLHQGPRAQDMQLCRKIICIDELKTACLDFHWCPYTVHDFLDFLCSSSILCLFNLGEVFSPAAGVFFVVKYYVHGNVCHM